LKNILVIRFSSLGDLVTQDIAYRAFRYFYPKAHIVFLTSSTGRSLYSESNYFDEYIVYDRTNFINTIKLLGKYEFDIVFNSQCSSTSYFLEFFIKSALTLHQSGEWWQKLLRIKTKTKWHPELLEISGIEKIKINSYMRIQENSIIHLPHLQKKFEWKDNNKKTIAVAIGASQRWESKKWGDERYLELINMLTAENHIILLIGSKSEIDSGNKIESQNNAVINLIDKTSLSELKSVLAAVDLLVGNDSGPAHLAAGVGTNTLTLFGSTDVKHCVKFGGYAGSHEYLVATPKLKCQPCYKPRCPTKHECMEAISIEQTAQTIQYLLERK